MDAYGTGNISANISVHDMNSSAYTTDYWYDLYYNEYVRGDKEHEISPLEILSLVLSIIGTIANSMSICVVKRIHKKLSTHLKLIINLCVSDCLILALSILKNILTMTKLSTICFNVAARLVADLALLATLLNLLAIAVDHYLAILKPLLYKKEMTSIRGIFAVLAIWIVSMLAISVEIVMGMINKKDMEPLCEAIAYDKINSEFGIMSFIFVVLFMIIVIYARIYICVVRNRATLSNMRHRQKDSSNIKALVTTSLFVLTFVLFWTPIGIFNTYMYTKDEEYVTENLKDIDMIGKILYLILLFNAIADPIIYTFRLPQVNRRCFTFKTNMRRQSTKMITLASDI